MKNKIVATITIYLFSITITSASLVFSEIMYDPEGSDTGREWVEVRNDGDNVLGTSYKFFESNTNHTITAFSGGNSIPSGGFAVIADNPAKFMLDFPSYNGILFDSSFSLSNSGEYIALKDVGGQVIDSITYGTSLGGNDDSTTLSYLVGAWGRGDATPGSVNTLSIKSVQGTSTTSGGGIPAQLASPSPDLTLYLPEDKIVVAGADAEFTANALQSSGVSPSNLLIDWSFGDGGARAGKTALYHYTEPGIYVVVVEANNGTLSAKNRMKVRVIDPHIQVVSAIKNDEKISIGIQNNSGFEIDMGQWKVSTDGLRYSIPKNTIALPKAITTLNGLELGMSTSTITLATTSLVFPGGKLLASSTYVTSPQKENTQLKNNVGNFVQKEKETTLSSFVGDSPSLVKIIKTRDNIFPISKKENISQSSTTIISVKKPEVTSTQKDKKISLWLKRIWPF